MVVFGDVVDIFLVGCVGFYFEEFPFIDEGSNDVLRGLLGYTDAVYFEAGISHDGGDEVSASYFSFTWNGGDAVKIPWMA